MIIYKLTKKNYKTKNNTLWEIGKKRELKTVNSPQLCSENVFHGYKNLNLGLLLNPIHACFANFKILECEGEIVIEDWSKLGTFSLLPIKELEMPKWYADVKVRKKVIILFSILCAEAVLSNFENSYPKDNRPRKAIEAAKEYLNNPSKSASESVSESARSAARSARSAESAARSAESAAWSAESAAWSARSAARSAWSAARSAARSARSAAESAAESAAWSAWSAARSARSAAESAVKSVTGLANNKKEINFNQIADKAIESILNDF